MHFMRKKRIESDLNLIQWIEKKKSSNGKFKGWKTFTFTHNFPTHIRMYVHTQHTFSMC